LVHLVSPFDATEDATPEELRSRLQILGGILGE
jgi:hypothetical protein